MRASRRRDASKAVGACTKDQSLRMNLRGGRTVSSITFMSGSTALSGGSNQWFCLLDSARNVLRKTADDGATFRGTLLERARGALGELNPALELLTARGNARLVLGLRDVLDDPRIVADEWARDDAEQAVRDHYDAVLFDLDGVLTSTAEIHADAWKQMFDDFLRERTSARWPKSTRR